MKEQKEQSRVFEDGPVVVIGVKKYKVIDDRWHAWSHVGSEWFPCVTPSPNILDHILTLHKQLEELRGALEKFEGAIEVETPNGLGWKVPEQGATFARTPVSITTEINPFKDAQPFFSFPSEWHGKRVRIFAALSDTSGAALDGDNHV